VPLLAVHRGLCAFGPVIVDSGHGDID
jgi:hypothetical protein